MLRTNFNKNQPDKGNFDEGYLNVGGGHNLYWASYGDASAPPVLLVHGGHGHVIDPEQFTAYAQSGKRVILLHQRGIGKSLPLGGVAQNSLEDNVQDIERLRGHLGIEKWDLFSWSFGATFMCAYAADYPQRCGKLTAYAPYLSTEQDWDVVTDKSFFAHHGAKNATEYTQNAYQRLVSATPDAWLQSLYNTHKTAGGQMTPDAFKASRSPAEWDRKFKESLIGALHEKEALNDLPPLWLAARTKASAGFSKLDVTLVFGDKDPWSAVNAATLAICPQAKVLHIPAATHDVHAPAVQSALKTILSPVKGARVLKKGFDLKGR